MRAAYQRQLDHYAVIGEILAIGNLKRMVHEGKDEHELKSDLPTGRTPPLTPAARKVAKRQRP